MASTRINRAHRCSICTPFYVSTDSVYYSSIIISHLFYIKYNSKILIIMIHCLSYVSTRDFSVYHSTLLLLFFIYFILNNSRILISHNCTVQFVRIEVILHKKNWYRITSLILKKHPVSGFEARGTREPRELRNQARNVLRHRSPLEFLPFFLFFFIRCIHCAYN